MDAFKKKYILDLVGLSHSIPIQSKKNIKLYRNWGPQQIACWSTNCSDEQGSMRS